MIHSNKHIKPQSPTPKDPISPKEPGPKLKKFLQRQDSFGPLKNRPLTSSEYEFNSSSDKDKSQ